MLLSTGLWMPKNQGKGVWCVYQCCPVPEKSKRRAGWVKKINESVSDEV